MTPQATLEREIDPELVIKEAESLRTIGLADEVNDTLRKLNSPDKRIVRGCCEYLHTLLEEAQSKTHMAYEGIRLLMERSSHNIYKSY